MNTTTKKTGYIFLILVYFQFGFTKYSHDRETILNNRSLISQIHNYTLYLKRISITYKIKEYAIVVNYTKKQALEKYTIFPIFFSEEITPSFVINLTGQPIIFHDDMKPYSANNRLINYIKNKCFPNEQAPWDTAHTSLDSITVPGQNHKTLVKTTNFDSGKMQAVPISPKWLFLTYRNAHLINIRESREGLTQ